jgi:hypothetical protein
VAQQGSNLGKRLLDDGALILQSHLMLVSQIAVALYTQIGRDPCRHKAILWCKWFGLSLAQGGSARLFIVMTA